MSKVCIITDSNSGITQSESKELGIVVIPMPFYINEVQHFEDIDMTQEEFYEALMDEKTEVSTSQPSPDTIMQTWRENLEEYDEIVHIPMSSGISSSCATAMMLAQEDRRKKSLRAKFLSLTISVFRLLREEVCSRQKNLQSGDTVQKRFMISCLGINSRAVFILWLIR